MCEEKELTGNARDSGGITTCLPQYILTAMSTYPHPQQSSNLSSWLCGVGSELDKQHHLASCCLLIGYGQREALGLPGRVVESLSQ